MDHQEADHLEAGLEDLEEGHHGVAEVLADRQEAVEAHCYPLISPEAIEEGHQEEEGHRGEEGLEEDPEEGHHVVVEEAS